MAGLRLMRRRREAEQAPMRLSAPVPGYLRVALGIAVALVFIAPVWWVVAASFKPQFAIFRDAAPVTAATFLPFDATLDNYREVFGRLGMGRALINSTIVAVSQVILTLVLCSTGAYAFSRLRFPGRRVLFIIILGTLLVPFESILIPMYLMASRLGLGGHAAGGVPAGDRQRLRPVPAAPGLRRRPPRARRRRPGRRSVPLPGLLRCPPPKHQAGPGRPWP